MPEAASLTYDAGALIAAERSNRRMWALAAALGVQMPLVEL